MNTVFRLNTESSLNNIDQFINNKFVFTSLTSDTQILKLESNLYGQIISKTISSDNHEIQTSMDTGSKLHETSQSYWDYTLNPTKVIHDNGDTVYVQTVNKKEKLFYNRKKMKINKMYYIKWLGDMWGLKRRADDTIDFYEFIPNVK